ncbi:Na/Pi cotransporter family protein [Candidatus Dojkabacteria bacterium]|nr:Na/Pi cotransporter family protein [Candidatus Dojkabacteria bacterium]
MKILDFTYFQIFLGVISALVLFLYAIDNLSNELQSLASEKFRTVLSKVVKNKYAGALVGIVATAITQSSTVVIVTVMTLVNTGVISFTNSLGVMLGSHIGTTLTAQLALVNSAAIASILIIIGFVLELLGKKFRYVSKPIFFLGLILFSLHLVSLSIEPLRENPEIMQLFSHLSNPILAYFASAIFTIIVQSSSVSTGMIVILASGGMVPIEVAIPMILGANMGTSFTALILSLKLNLYARRAGIANFLVNFLGTLLFMIFLNPFTSLMTSIATGAGQQVALAHLLFNLFSAVIFLLLLKPFEKLIVKIVKGQEEEILFETKYIDGDQSKNLQSRIKDIKKELAYSIESTIKIYQKAVSAFYNTNKLTLMEIHKLETLNDFLDDEITKAIISLSKFKLSEKDAQRTVALVKISNTIEQLGDLGKDFSQIFERVHDLGIEEKDVNIEKLVDIHNRLMELFRIIEKAILGATEQELMDIKLKEEEIYTLIREEFDIHVNKLQKDDRYNGGPFVDAISIIELSVSKVRDIRKLLLKQEREYPKH